MAGLCSHDDNEKRPAHLPIVPVSTEKPGGSEPLGWVYDTLIIVIGRVFVCPALRIYKSPSDDVRFGQVQQHHRITAPVCTASERTAAGIVSRRLSVSEAAADNS